jgi:HSP20 family protein
MSKIMPKKKAGALAVQKAKKPALAVREPQTSWINSVNTMLDTFRLIPWDPFRGFEWPVEYELPTRIPYVDVIDSGAEYVVKAELPGLKKETLVIDVGTNELSVAADSDVEREEKGKTYLHRERAFSTFRRNIGFPESIDPEKVSANMAEGILEIRLPKLEPRREKKTRRLTLPLRPATGLP